ncbi:MAG: hypothetical protein J5527_09805 [Treponema sp.]|nr:hypothetical protein [Treponema sp.]
MKEQHQLSKLNPAMKTEEMENILWEVLNKIFTGADRSKFKLYSVEEKSYAYARDFDFCYNVHYGQNTIKYTMLLKDRFWKIECENFAKTASLQMNTKYYRSGYYLYSLKEDRIAPLKRTTELKEEILTDKGFRIEENGNTNYFEIEERINREKEEQKKSSEENYFSSLKESKIKEQQEEKERKEKRTVTDSVQIECELIPEQNADVSTERFIKELLKNYKVYYYEEIHTSKNTAIVYIGIQLPAEAVWPGEKTKNFCKTVKEMLESVFGGKAEYTLDGRSFPTEEEAKKYAESRIEGEKKKEEIRQSILEYNESNIQQDLDEKEEEDFKIDEYERETKTTYEKRKITLNTEKFKGVAKKIERLYDFLHENGLEIRKGTEIIPDNDYNGNLNALKFEVMKNGMDNVLPLLELFESAGIKIRSVYENSFGDSAHYSFNILYKSRFFGNEEEDVESEIEIINSKKDTLQENIILPAQAENDKKEDEPFFYSLPEDENTNEDKEDFLENNNEKKKSQYNSKSINRRIICSIIAASLIISIIIIRIREEIKKPDISTETAFRINSADDITKDFRSEIEEHKQQKADDYREEEAAKIIPENMDGDELFEDKK